MSLNKTTRLTEKVRLQFRAEAFNLSNSPRFAPPNQTLGNAAFATVNAMGNLPRVLQFGLKLSY